MPKLTEILTNTNDRVTALENNGLDEAAGIARITKVYGNIKLTAVVTANVTFLATANDDLYPDTDIWTNEINFL